MEPVFEVLLIVKVKELPVRVKFETVAVMTGVKAAVAVFVVIASALAITLKVNIITAAALVNSILRIISYSPLELFMASYIRELLNHSDIWLSPLCFEVFLFLLCKVNPQCRRIS
jgi:hypothetical protein